MLVRWEAFDTSGLQIWVYASDTVVTRPHVTLVPDLSPSGFAQWAAHPTGEAARSRRSVSSFRCSLCSSGSL